MVWEKEEKERKERKRQRNAERDEEMWKKHRVDSKAVAEKEGGEGQGETEMTIDQDAITK